MKVALSVHLRGTLHSEKCCDSLGIAMSHQHDRFPNYTNSSLKGISLLSHEGWCGIRGACKKHMESNSFSCQVAAGNRIQVNIGNLGTVTSIIIIASVTILSKEVNSKRNNAFKQSHIIMDMIDRKLQREGYTAW